MPEKISDIYYPKSNLSLEPVEPEKEKVVPKIQKKKLPKRRNFLPLIFWGIILLIIILFAVFSLSQAQIEIWPETQNLSFQERIEISTKVKEPDFEAQIFPGKDFEITLEKSQAFSATGKTLQGVKAKGVIQVYNAYSTEEQVLVANTRFISAEGKLFRSLKRAVIPGGKYDNKGKLTPGILDVEVVAAEVGGDYNVGPSTFSIPGFAGTAKYTSFYGKSFSAMSGGFRGEAPQVTQEDLRLAEEGLRAKLFEEGEKVLKDQIPPDFILLQDAHKIENIEFIPGVKGGDAVSNFNSQIKGVLKVIAFKQSDLENFSKELILKRVPREENFSPEGFFAKIKIQESSFKLDYKIYSIDWEKGVMILDAEFSAKVYPDIEETLFKKALVGKPLKEAEIMLSGQPQIKQVNVSLRPFWVKKVPQNLEKIKIKLNID